MQKKFFKKCDFSISIHHIANRYHIIEFVNMLKLGLRYEGHN